MAAGVMPATRAPDPDLPGMPLQPLPHFVRQSRHLVKLKAAGMNSAWSRARAAKLAAQAGEIGA